MRGHIRKRGERSWAVVLSLGLDPGTGRRRQRWISVKGTKKDAERRLVELLAEYSSGGGVEPSNMTLATYLREWLDTQKVRASSLAGYRYIVEKRLIPSLGAIKLADLKPWHIREAQARWPNERRDRRAGELSPTTIRHYHIVLSQALNDAVDLELLSRNPAKAVGGPRQVRPKPRPMRGNAPERFLAAASTSKFLPLFFVALHTGMRRSELLGLRWGDIDLDMADLVVARGYHRFDGRGLIEPPKSESSGRLIALTSECAVFLRNHLEASEDRARQVGREWGGADEYVFSEHDGRPMSPYGASAAFRKVKTKAGLKNVSLKDTRHTHATKLLAAGVNIKIIQERLGHASEATTADIYLDPGPEEHRKAADLAQDVLPKAPSKPVG